MSKGLLTFAGPQNAQNNDFFMYTKTWSDLKVFDQTWKIHSGSPVSNWKKKFSRVLFIRLSNFLFMPCWFGTFIFEVRSESNTEIQSSNIFKSDIRQSLEEHGFFKYFLAIFEIFEKQISILNAYFQKKRQLFSWWWWSFFSLDCTLHMLLIQKEFR